MLVLRSGCDGRGGKPRGGRVKVLGLVLTDGWKSLITSSVSFCVMNLSARLIVTSLACSCWLPGELSVVSESDLTQHKIAGCTGVLPPHHSSHNGQHPDVDLPYSLAWTAHQLRHTPTFTHTSWQT